MGTRLYPRALHIFSISPSPYLHLYISISPTPYLHLHISISPYLHISYFWRLSGDMEIFSDFWRLSGVFWRYSSIFGDILRFLEIFSDFWRYSPISGDIEMEIWRYGDMEEICNAPRVAQSPPYYCQYVQVFVVSRIIGLLIIQHPCTLFALGIS